MELNNPSRNGPSISSYSWKKIEDTFYEDEDVLVLIGTQKSGNNITLYNCILNYFVYFGILNTYDSKINKYIR